MEGKYAALALAVADVLLINMWAADAGREVAACKPLLETILQVCRWPVRPTILKPENPASFNDRNQSSSMLMRFHVAHPRRRCSTSSKPDFCSTAG
jgi:hypothetical protein